MAMAKRPKPRLVIETRDGFRELVVTLHSDGSPRLDPAEDETVVQLEEATMDEPLFKLRVKTRTLIRVVVVAFGAAGLTWSGRWLGFL
jgi:hypothetical protein